MVGTEEPVLEVPDGTISQGHHGFRVLSRNLSAPASLLDFYQPGHQAGSPWKGVRGGSANVFAPLMVFLVVMLALDGFQGFASFPRSRWGPQGNRVVGQAMLLAVRSLIDPAKQRAPGAS